MAFVRALGVRAEGGPIFEPQIRRLVALAVAAFAAVALLIVVLGTLLLSGCVGGYDPHGLILVAVDEDVQRATVNGVAGEEVVRRAAREWDAVGARFRAVEDLEAGDVPDAVLHVHSMPVNATSAAGWYSVVDGVHLDLRRWSGYWTEDLAVHSVAHEMGHAIGLHHVSDCGALMAGEDQGCHVLLHIGITPADVDEYHQLWGAR